MKQSLSYQISYALCSALNKNKQIKTTKQQPQTVVVILSFPKTLYSFYFMFLSRSFLFLLQPTASDSKQRYHQHPHSPNSGAVETI